MFLVGAVFFGALLVYLSSFVLIIKIEGLEGQNRQKIIHSLKNAGLKAGLPRQELMARKRYIEQQLMLSNPEAVWIGVSVHGVVAQIKVVPRKMPPITPGPCDIVSGQDGVVDQVVAFQGVPVVGEGDTVAQGDLLISGIRWRLDPASGDFIQENIAASGVIKAKVWYDIEVIEPKVIWLAYPVSGRGARYSLRFGRNTWTVAQFGKKPTGNYFWERRTKRIYQGRNPYEGVELIKDTYQKVVFHKIRRSKIEIRRSALAEAAARRKQLKNITFRRQNEVWTEEGQFIKLNLSFETVREIGMAVPR
jgi:similar to stage IV sporulation protein